MEDFLRVCGHDIIDADGRKFFIRGVNVGHWLNPEGYMFRFGKTTSPHLIDLAFRQMVGPGVTAEFWRRFKDNYITENDIAFIASTGANTVRVPFHYKLFTKEEYLGSTDPREGFRRLDAVVGWCRKHSLRVILDMHDCPGGQTGSNIDDSDGYAWLFDDDAFIKLYCSIWRKIAEHYADDPAVLGYDLMNEPISNRIPGMEHLNTRLVPVQMQAARAIRRVDKKHILIFAGAQWNTNFEPFDDIDLVDNSILQCHHYDFNNPKYDQGQVLRYAAVRDKVGVPMYMGETGHNVNDWYRSNTVLMEKKNIGWTYWPLKMPDSSCWFPFPLPKGWNEVVSKFVESDRSNYDTFISNRPDQKEAARLLMEYAENCRAEHCHADNGYLKALGLNV